jgi:CDP-diacylglycerol--serine O-phosphatidyltransferase
MIKKHIPNFITLLNLLSGLIAILFAIKGALVFAAFFIILGIFLDFFDGLAARLLNVSGEFGKQLDSLADMVTSGVAPAMIMYALLEKSQSNTDWYQNLSLTIDNTTLYMFPLIGFIIALAAAYRLANFNIDERQTSSFIGLPTPAMTLVIVSLPLIQQFSQNEVAINLLNNKYVLIAITLGLSYLMNANLPLFSLKFKNLSLKDNALVFIFLLISLVLLISLQFVAVPLIILVYILLSIIQNIRKK